LTDFDGPLVEWLLDQFFSVVFADCDGWVVVDQHTDAPDDGIEAVDLFSYQLLPGFFGVDDYASLIKSLQRGAGKRQLITFPYDWRLSNRHAATRLETTALDALKVWRAESGNDGAKLWLVCHSMGGLVARYFCECLGGAAHTRAIITIGTPHRGSVRALDALVNGKRFGPIDVTRTVRSLPSVYELLPLFQVIRQEAGNEIKMLRIAELFGLDPVTGSDIAGWIGPDPGQSPPPGIDRDMLKRSLEFHAGIRAPAEARAQRDEPSPYQQKAFFNRRQPTALSARLNGKELQILNTYREERGGRWIEEDFPRRRDRAVLFVRAHRMEPHRGRSAGCRDARGNAGGDRSARYDLQLAASPGRSSQERRRRPGRQPRDSS
jgi:pimeloyl-ACP methyl ester carboxylesterase